MAGHAGRSASGHERTSSPQFDGKMHPPHSLNIVWLRDW